MLYKLLLCIVLFFNCILSYLAAQQELTAIEQKDLIESYFGNRNLFKAEQLHYQEREPIAARVFYEKAILTLEEEQNWKGSIFASKGLSLTYLGKDDFEVGIAIAKASLDKMRNQTSVDKKYSFQLLHAISRLYGWARRPLLALPYAHNNKLWHKPWSYVIWVVKLTWTTSRK